VAATRAALLLTFARRGEEEAILRAMEVALAQLPGARLVAIGTPVSAPVLRELGLTEVLVYGEGQAAKEVVGRARRIAPEVAVIVYDESAFRGHLKLEGLAWATRAGRVLRCPPEGDVRSIGRPALAVVVLGKSLWMGIRTAGAALGLAVAYLVLSLAQHFPGGRGAGRA
jgi:hypothetical protein